jgi:hypothetical protein
MALVFLAMLSFIAVQGTAKSDETSTITAVSLKCPMAAEDCRPTTQLVVKILKISRDYAKATIAPRDGSGETDIAYLRKIDGQWVLLDQGTGVNPHDLGIPEEIW